MAFEVKTFVFGTKTPEWFDENAKSGRVKINYDDEGEILNATVYTPTKTLIAEIGDTIMLLKSGLTVIKKDKAIKYNVQKEVVKNVKE